MSLGRCSEICQQHARLMCCWFFFGILNRRRREEKGAPPISFMTVSYHSLSSRLPADCLVLARWIIWMECRLLVRRENREGDTAGEATVRTTFEENQENIRAEFCSWPDSRLSQRSVSQTRYAITCQSTSKWTGLPFYLFYFFLSQVLSVCSKYLSTTEWMCVCVFIYMIDPWQKLLSHHRDRLSPLRRWDVWNVRCLSEWSIHAVHMRTQIECLTFYWGKCCMVDQIYWR